MSQFQFEVSDSAAPADLAAIDKGLTEFNEQSANLASVRPLHVVARDESGQLIGGLIGRTWGLCCEIQVLWVDESTRQSGVGTTLVRQAEAEAARRECVTAFLETFSFQAPEFYARLGYETKHQIDGMPDGICKSYMLRQLSD